MKQILQNLGSGETILADVPCPRVSDGQVLIRSERSLVSLGTEKMLVDFGKSGYLAKARSQPDKVRQVIQKVSTDGLWSTLDAVRAKLDSPIALGYCNVGRIVQSGLHHGFAVGDRVISNGAHAEIVSVSSNLVARIPDNVSDDVAAYAVVSAIGLQGIRLVEPTLGEKVVVSGLGLIGLLTVQMLRAHGCEVMGIDFDRRKLDLAASFGASVVDLGSGEDPVRAAEHWTGGSGVDAVLITASTKSHDLIHQAAAMCRKRGRIVLIGVIGLNLRRADFYEKELTFQVSCSYGPGRYDLLYEKKGYDYPIGFVRWTEKRNFEAVLQLMSDGKIATEPLTTHRFEFEKALDAYQSLSDPGAMGILLEYSGDEDAALLSRTVRQVSAPTAPGLDGIKPGTGTSPVIGFIGAGAFATRMLLPLLPKAGVIRRAIVSSTGLSATHAGKKFGFDLVSTDSGIVWNDSQINSVFITTPHHNHAELTCRALEAGKNVYVEKPLAMNASELSNVADAVASNPGRCLMVGFNRRFSPHTQLLRRSLRGSPGAKSIIITINAGMIPAEHWTQDPEIGGGRIIGEACHFIDLARYLLGAPILDVHANAMTGGDGSLGDCVAIELSFEDGSIATVHYLANGNKSYPKERIEVFAGGTIAVIDNFRRTKVIGGSGKLKTRAQDKGHRGSVEAFLKTVEETGDWPIPWEQLLEVTRTTIQADEQIRMQLAKPSTRISDS